VQDYAFVNDNYSCLSACQYFSDLSTWASQYLQACPNSVVEKEDLWRAILATMPEVSPAEKGAVLRCLSNILKAWKIVEKKTGRKKNYVGSKLKVSKKHT
jgi:hypothetical protein